MKQAIVALVLIGCLFGVQLNAQDTLKNRKDGHYYFTVVNDIEANEVQNQNRTATCWSFSALSFLESELIRMGKGKHKLSEMYVVRKAYEDKVEKYIRMHGSIGFGQGGAFHDVTYVLDKYGIVPEEVYKGLNYGDEKHNHSEMAGVLKGMCDAIIKNRQGKLTTSWKNAVNAVLDAYLGEVPEKFTYLNKEYTVEEFTASLGLDMSDYITLTSYTHHPFYKPFILEVPDNWIMGVVYNLPVDEFMSNIDNALLKGYSVAWAADVSEKGFSFKNGLAIIPENPENLKMKGKHGKQLQESGTNKNLSQFDEPGMEKIITQEMRQTAFDNFQTTDDHGMHFTGIVTDQKGNKYYIVKNSWGQENDCDGNMYASMPYVRYKTMNVMLHKDVLSKALCRKLDLDDD